METETYTVHICLPRLPTPGTCKPLTYNDRLIVNVDPAFEFARGSHVCACELNAEQVALSLTVGRVADFLDAHNSLKFHLDERPYLVQLHWDRTPIRGACIVAVCSGLVHGHDAATCYPGVYPFHEIEERMRNFQSDIRELKGIMGSGLDS